MRHIGDSLFPPSDKSILQPVETPFGILQVRTIADLDTHGLFHKHARGESLLATHPNGYSCHYLMEQLVKRNATRARQQIQYILDCGGMAKHPDHIVNSMEFEP